MSVAKEEARKLLDKIPETATWDDIMYEFYLRQKIETALADAEAGRVVSQDEIEAEFLPK